MQLLFGLFGKKISGVSLGLILFFNQVYFFTPPSVSIDPSDYFSLTYQILLSTSEVTEGQSFSVTVTGTAVCKQPLPVSVSSATTTGRVTAQLKGGSNKIILNPNYTVTVDPFPGEVGQSIQVEQIVPLAFPTGSTFGVYIISGELIDATIQTIIGTISVKSFLPETGSIGSVNYKPSTPTGGGGGYASPAPTPPYLLAPSVNSLFDYINALSGIFEASFVGTSKDNKCQVLVNLGVKGLDAQSKPLSQIIITPVTKPPTSSNGSVIGLAYELGPTGATFTPTVTLTILYDKSSLPAGVNENQLRLAAFDPATRKWVPEVDATPDTSRSLIKSQISLFNTYAILAYTPAQFKIKDLSINPTQAIPGQNITIAGTVSNTGGLSGDYMAMLKMDGKSVGTKVMTVEPGATLPVSFTVTGDTGLHSVDLNGLAGEFKILSPASFQVSNLIVFPAITTQNAEVTISATIINLGDIAGEYEAQLKVDGTINTSKKVSVAGKGQESITFKVSSDVTGTHAITLGTSNASLIVQTTPTNPAPSFNWWLPTGIAFGAAILLLAIYFLTRQRKQRKS